MQVVAVTAVRTGSGKSQVSKYVIGVLKEHGLKTVLVRHPMPYGVYALPLTTLISYGHRESCTLTGRHGVSQSSSSSCTWLQELPAREAYLFMMTDCSACVALCMSVEACIALSRFWSMLFHTRPIS